MKTINSSYEASFRERGSKFLGFLFPCENEQEFGIKLNALKSNYSDASHHCYGYRIDPNSTNEFSSDDGEPSGTAGLPILNQLRSFEVVNAGLVVVRYFGGTKLGKTGLIESYGGCAKDSLSKAQLLNIVQCQWFELSYDYKEQSVIEKLKTDFNLEEDSASYLERIVLKVATTVELALSFEKRVDELVYLSISCQKLDLGFYYN